MAADKTMTVNPQKITISADTNDHTLDCSAFIRGAEATAVIQTNSGTIRFNNGGTVDGTNSAPYTTETVTLTVYKNAYLHYKGNAGSETFNINIVN